MPPSDGTGVVVQTVCTTWPAYQLITAGIVPALLGLGLLVAGWTSPPSLVLLLSSGIVAGAGGGAIFRGCLALVIFTSDSDDRAGALATYFLAGCPGQSVPMRGLGLLFQHLRPRVTLLIFAMAVGLGILAAAPVLVCPLEANSIPRRSP